MKIERQNKAAEVAAWRMKFHIPADGEIVTREIVQLADVILAIARHETVDGDVRAVAE